MAERLKARVSPAQFSSLKATLLSQFRGLRARVDEKAEQNCTYRLDIKLGGELLVIKQYTNGTFYADASSSALMAKLKSIMDGKVALSQAGSGSDSSKRSAGGTDVSIIPPYCGSDESGKGDYFGPLVVASVFLEDGMVSPMEEFGVTDSKLMNDAHIIKIGPSLMEQLGPERVAVITLMPSDYNARYQSMTKIGKNLNHLLGGLHAELINQLIGANPTCPLVVVDQFSVNDTISPNLAKTRNFKLIQQTKAERHLGVAAASVVARWHFLKAMSELNETFNWSFPLGAGGGVESSAKNFVARHGEEALGQVAKLHFVTTQRVLG